MTRLRKQAPAPAIEKRATVAPQVVPPSLDGLPRAELEAMRAAGVSVRKCMRVLEKADLNLVGEVLRGNGTFFEMEHYPPDDVNDTETGSQYYYHAHRGAGEHGHFHLFVRAKGMPDGVAPAANRGEAPWPSGSDAIAHLIAISMDVFGVPKALFAVNRWVTDETWYPAEDVVRMVDRFKIDHAQPSWPLNIWLGQMLVLFRPQVEALIRHRDATVAYWHSIDSSVDVFEDRTLEMTGMLSISIDDQIIAINRALEVEGASEGRS